MKKLLIISMIAMASVSTMYSQTIDEALKYSQIFYGGTARFLAMGGAFTSLGGDLSTLSQNPAGLGVFRSIDFSVSAQMHFNNSTSVYENSTSYEDLYDFNLNQIGLVYPIFNKDNTEGFSGFNFGYSYNKTNDFNSLTSIRGVNNNSSMADYWANQANDTHFTELYGAEGIAFDAWLIDTITGSGGWNYATVFSEYGDQANSTYGQSLRRAIVNEGNIGEHALSLSANFGHKIYLGFTFGINTLYSYTRYEHLESDYDLTIFDFNNFIYTDIVESQGRGYAYKMGLIIKPTNTLRLGFAFHAPTVYRIDEYYYDDIYSEFDNGDFYEASNDPNRFTYTMTSPLRLMGGAAIQLGKIGMVSADYEFVDYRNAKFSKASDGYSYTAENQDITDIFYVAHNFRVGAEVRLKPIYLRGGYALNGSGFAPGEENEESHYSTYSGGLGIRQSNFYFDVSYSLRKNSQQYFMYSHPDINPAELTYARSMINITLGFKF